MFLISMLWMWLKEDGVTFSSFPLQGEIAV